LKNYTRSDSFQKYQLEVDKKFSDARATSNKDQAIQSDKLKVYVDQRMEDLKKGFCERAMFLEEMSFV